MSDETKVSSSELSLVTSMITQHMDTRFGELNNRFDRLENEIKPKIVEHNDAIIAIRTEKEVERRWRRWTPPVSAGAVAATFEGLRHLVAWLRHP